MSLKNLNFVGIRLVLSHMVRSADQKHIKAANEDSEIKEFITTLSDDDIAKLVREINQEFYQNREAAREIEIKNREPGRQLSAVQTHCKHSNEEVDSEGSMELRTCKLCGRSRTLNYSTSNLHRRF